MSTAKLLFRGAGLQGLTIVVSVASSFFLAPFVIHSLGDRWYGLWVVIGTFISFYGLFDFGISSAVQRYLAAAIPRNDPDELNAIIANSLVMYCGIGLLAFVVTLAIVACAPMLGHNKHDIGVFREVTLLLGTGFAISLPCYTQYGILAASLRYDYSSYLQIGKTTLRTALFFLVLSLGYGIVSLAAVTVLVNVLGYIALILITRAVAPWLKLRRRHFSTAKARELTSFGLYAFIGQIARRMKFEIDNVVIAGILGLGPVTHFNIATKLNGYFFTGMDALVPAPTSLYARYQGHDALRHIRQKYVILSRISTTVGVLGIGAVLIFARPFISLWVGPQYLDAFIPLVIIMACRIPDLTQRASEGALYALDRQKFVAYLNLGEGVANLALSVLLAPRYGITGVALGTAIPLVATRLTILPVYICRAFSLPLRAFLAEVAPIIAVSVVIQLPLVYLVSDTEISSYWQIVMWATGYYIPVFIFVYLVMLTNQERMLFAEAMPSIRAYLQNRKRVRQTEIR